MSDSLDHATSFLTTNHVEEALSRSYVSAVAAQAGVDIARSEYDYGVDGTFRRLTICKGERTPSGMAIDFQLKASTRFHPAEKAIGFDLECRAYNLLCRRYAGKGTPMILLVVLLPHNRAEWLQVDADRLVLKKCCYWYYRGADQPTENTQTKRIFLEKSKLFTPEALLDMLARIEDSTPLG